MSNFETRLACVITAEGKIARGYQIDTCELIKEGEYVISWKVPLQGDVKTNFSCVVGSVLYETVEPGFCTVGLLEDPMKMRVCTYSVMGQPSNRPFHLACFRD